MPDDDVSMMFGTAFVPFLREQKENRIKKRERKRSRGLCVCIEKEQQDSQSSSSYTTLKRKKKIKRWKEDMYMRVVQSSNVRKERE